MIDSFKSFLQAWRLPEKDIEAVSNEFSGIVLMAILSHTLDRISETEEERVVEYFRTNRIAELWSFLKQKHSEEEWNKLLKQEIGPLVESYFKEVMSVV